MAHIIYNTQPGGPGQMLINGIDFSSEIYDGTVKLVEVGEGDASEVGLQITLAVSTLTLDNESDVQVTGNFPSVAQKVRAMSEAS